MKGYPHGCPEYLATTELGGGKGKPHDCPECLATTELRGGKGKPHDCPEYLATTELRGWAEIATRIIDGNIKWKEGIREVVERGNLLCVIVERCKIGLMVINKDAISKTNK